MQNVYAASGQNTAANVIQQLKSCYEQNFISSGDTTKLNLDKLPPGWEVLETENGMRYYLDRKNFHKFVIIKDLDNNHRTHWIHPLAPEILAPGWNKIFDQIHGVVYYKWGKVVNNVSNIISSHIERRSQFEHPGLGTSTIVGPMLPTIHGSASLQSVEDEQMDSQVQRRDLIEADEEFDAEEDDSNIINSEDVPEWLKLYSQAPFTSDHLLNFNLFKLGHLEHFDRMHFQMLF